MINSLVIEMVEIVPIKDGNGLKYYGIHVENDVFSYLETHSSLDEPYEPMPFPSFKNAIEALDYALSKTRYNQDVWTIINDNQLSELGITINGEYITHNKIHDLCEQYFPREGYEPSELFLFEIQRKRRF